MEKKHLNIYLEHTNITCFTECSFLWLYILAAHRHLILYGLFGYSECAHGNPEPDLHAHT